MSFNIQSTSHTQPIYQHSLIDVLFLENIASVSSISIMPVSFLSYLSHRVSALQFEHKWMKGESLKKTGFIFGPDLKECSASSL